MTDQAEAPKEIRLSCPNQDCIDYGKVGVGNIIKFGKTRQGVQRLQCKTCRTTFTATYGSLFYRRRTSPKDILETLALLAEGVSISSLARAKKIKADTILSWLREAARHSEAVEAILLTEYRLNRAQIDTLWNHLKPRDESASEVPKPVSND